MDDLIAQAKANREARQNDTQAHAKDIQDLQKHNELRSGLANVAATVSRTILAHKPAVTVLNPVTSVKTPDAQQVVEAVNRLETALKPLESDPTPIVKAVMALIPLLKAIPGAIHIPEAPDSVKVNNFEGVIKVLEAINGNVIAQATKFEPNISVNSPEVKVEAPNMTTIEAGLAAILKAVEANRPPEPPVTDLNPLIKSTEATTGAINGLRFPTASITPTDPLIRYSPADVDDAGTVQYFGFTDMTGAWYVQRMDTGASPKTLRYARGTTAYPAGWTGRASLTYDYLYATFGA
jgi:hypothetical protein